MTLALADPQLLDDRYRLEEVLGTGGAAVVRRARDERLKRDVAVKLFHPGTADEQRCTGELSLMASLTHPALVRMYDAGQRTDTNGARSTYLVMEYLPGPTLHRALAAGGLSKAEVAAVGGDLASALAYIHGRGVVHRDVKPANVLLTPDADEFAAKLADFGIARLLDGTRVTATGTTVGTANYLSPEQVRGAEAGPPSDVYSLGLVLLEALTGQIVYPGVGITAALARLSRAPEIPSSLGPVWCALLRAMLDADPLVRPDAAQVRRALEGVEVATGPAAAAPPSAARSAAPLAAGQLAPEALTEVVTRPPGAHRPGRRAGAMRTLMALLAVGSAAAVLGALAAFLVEDTTQSAGTPNDPSPSSPPTTSRLAPVAAPVEATVSRGAASVPTTVTTKVTPLSEVVPATVARAPSPRVGARALAGGPGAGPGNKPGPPPAHGHGPGAGPGRAKEGHGHGGK